ncbi:helix-turn-helix transcriptional regulator [Flagellimonas okinawensis]|uniref:AraC family transcriptional regulator n=1 Tax=Flagellimonas okinawensis TaxID=3031324 RepID=A0ABT5XPL5_9FLAO|nr:AraC family transcriptional regulator [[Muricauda] okinawensis]MDF0707842.1 AraC family transcriptional regulator [[Muricauda] okinawensis]
MQSILKSHLFRNSVYLKEYPKNFRGKELVENLIPIDLEDVEGEIHEQQLDGIFVVRKDIRSTKGYSFQVSSDFSVFVIHFEIAGNFRYVPKDGSRPLLEIPSFHYNMFYLPRANGTLEYKEGSRKTLELVFTSELIKQLAGDDYEKVWANVSEAINSEEPFVFWNKPRSITPELELVLDEITNCPFQGKLKHTYLQSKLVTLLVNLLIEANGRSKSLVNHNLPKSDFDSLCMVEDYIKSNLSSNLNISDLAAIAGFNESKLKKDFKLVYGNTIFKYITRLRMEMARKLIKNKSMTIAQAAHEVGYANPQHFTKAFKRTLGYLPSILKK